MDSEPRASKEEPDRFPARRYDALRGDLVIVSGVVSLIAVIAPMVHTGWAVSLGVGRLWIRDTAIIWIGRYVADAADWNLLGRLPLVVNQPLSVDSPADLTRFLFGGIVVNLCWAATFVLVTFMAWSLLDRMLRRIESRRDAVLVSSSAALFVLPMIVAAVDHFTRTQQQSMTIGLAFLAATLLGILTFLVCRQYRNLLKIAGRMLWASFALAILVGAAVIGFPATTTGTGASAEQVNFSAPNILLVSIDSLRADRLHCYGNNHLTSPAIDGLADEGVLFENAIAPTSWTLPSHITLMTALPPEIHGVNTDYLRLRDDALTLATILRDEGYETAGFVSGIYLERRYGLDSGFDHYDDYSFVRSSPRFQRKGDTSHREAELVNEWFDQWTSEGALRPFFAFVHLWDVHYDYTPPSPWDTMFDPAYAGPITGDDIRLSETIFPGMPDNDLRHLLALYDGEIRSTDDAIALVLNRLEEIGVLDDTVVVILSDHGEEFLEHDDVAHRRTLYDEVIHIPLIIRYPARINPGTRIPQQVRLMDVAPTILELAGIDRRIGVFDTKGNETWMARNLIPLLDATTAKEVPPLPAFGELEGRAISVRTSRAKLIVNLSDQRTELYDLVSDPREQTNLAERDEASVNALLSQLSSWANLERKGVLADPNRLSPEHEEILRSLGYLR